MKKNVNQETIEGRIYQFDLAMKKVERKDSPNYGKDFIQGTIEVATDEACTNIIPVHYSYVAEKYNSGKDNINFGRLSQIINTAKTVTADGKDVATKVRLMPAAALNDFYPNGQDEVVSQQRNEGGFVNLINELNSAEDQRNTFEFDTIITNVVHIEADAERGIEKDFLKLRGIIFDFRNAILPWNFVVRKEDAIKYFENLDITNASPFYTRVKGVIVSSTTKTEKKEEGAFGTESVDVIERKTREWVINWAAKNPYEFDTEETITSAELKKAIEDRNLYLAEVKARSDEYYAGRGNAIQAGAPANATIPEGGFKF